MAAFRLVQYFTYSVLMVMVSCAVYQSLVSMLKLVLLLAVCAAYLTMMLATHLQLFCQHDFLVSVNALYCCSIQYNLATK